VRGATLSLSAMARAQAVTFYLDESLRLSAAAGQHNFIGKVADVFRASGVTVAFRANSAAARIASALRPGYAIFHMNHPTHDRAVTMRRVYHYPFWQIEPTAERWQWHVARSAFVPDEVDPVEARRFQSFWRKRLFADAAPVQRGGFVYIPLQGRLTEQRSFQAASPVDMVKAALSYDVARPVVATFHPKEIYSAAERQAIHDLAAQNPRLSVQTGGMENLLPQCDYIVTQNSSAAFNGLFFDKPILLFARSDFHHIAANASALGVAGAFQAVQQTTPDSAAYLWWFWQKMAINAGRPEAEDQIRASLQRAGWPV